MNKIVELEHFLTKFLDRNTLIFCIGNELRHDDGVGPYIANKLIKKGYSNVLNAGQSPENYVNFLIESNYSKILIIDSVTGLDKPGDITFFEGIEGFSSINVSLITTHNIPLPFLLRYVKLRKRELRIGFIGIQVKDVSLGIGLSNEVLISANIVINLIDKALSLKSKNHL